jgi:endonuclease/exonuclease/phosphatase family metal-dependent hydrolase
VNVALLLLTAAALTADDRTDDGIPVKFLSFNIRYGTASDGENAWPYRRDLVFRVIRETEPDFCGLQEALRFQIDEIQQAISGYAEHGGARDDGQTKGEYSAILYRRDRWRLAAGDTQWLSDTPDRPGSTSWGNQIPRIVTWGRFVEQRTGRAVCVFNTHFDHRSQPSRERSAQFLSALIARVAATTPVIVMGDFNAGEDNPAIEQLKSPDGDQAVALVDTYRVLHPQADDVGTFNGFLGRTDGPKIDYVFSGPSVRVLDAQIIRTHAAARYPSDHFPVSATVSLPAS